ncbi:hypothetical protein [Vibrio sp. ER1A]|uniref:hypothetical protein n=1 Tax=Vibrio sp. ER1A TaxID=1517681 RepID=UPI0004DCF072|nr:hypothetical protein [Vibrio sp. ER1A]KFA99464.1 hypothetical protein HW45_03640 [Vibrio sp. ER1A]
MTLKESVNNIFLDLLGIKPENYYEDWMNVAFADQKDLDELGCGINAHGMKVLLANVLERRTGATASIILAGMTSPNATKAIAAKNFIDLRWVLEKECVQYDKPIVTFDRARLILAFQRDVPKFGEALAYVVETGKDVPQEQREYAVKQLEQAAKEDGIALTDDNVIEVPEASRIAT